MLPVSGEFNSKEKKAWWRKRFQALSLFSLSPFCNFPTECKWRENFATCNGSVLRDALTCSRIPERFPGHFLLVSLLFPAALISALPTIGEENCTLWCSFFFFLLRDFVRRERRYFCSLSLNTHTQREAPGALGKGLVLIRVSFSFSFPFGWLKRPARKIGSEWKSNSHEHREQSRYIVRWDNCRHAWIHHEGICPKFVKFKFKGFTLPFSIKQYFSYS